MQINKIKILLVEDSSEDVFLIQKSLEKRALTFDIKLVVNEQDYIQALHSFNPDLILSDYAIPGFSGLMAMIIKEKIRPEIPFIFITGRIGEELAAETILNGAYGFILKTNLSELPKMVENAVKERSLKKRYSVEGKANKWQRQNEITRVLLSDVNKYLEATKSYSKNTSRAYIENIKKHLQQLKDFDA